MDMGGQKNAGRGDRSSSGRSSTRPPLLASLPLLLFLALTSTAAEAGGGGAGGGAAAAAGQVQNPDGQVATESGTAGCPRKCSCRNISENIHSLRVRCDEQQIASWRELDFGEDVTASIVGM